MSRQPILILGASGRAAAASALRAGFDPFVLDLFADADTEHLCPVRKLPMADYPHGFVALAKTLPPMPWMYTGGLENHPNVVAAISESRDLWGNGPDVLAKVRDPFRLSDLLSVKGLSHPRSLPGRTTPLPAGVWLRKPLRGSAGFGISFADRDTVPSDDHFYQAFLEGVPMSAVFFQSKLLGLTRQLIGTDWLHAPAFRYAGTIGGIDIAPLDMQVPILTGFRLGTVAGVRGVYGIDFVHDGEWGSILEVNPRYPASVEVIEYATGASVLDWHRSAFWKRSEKPADVPPPKSVVGKAIYYAPHTLVVPASGPWDESLAHYTDVWRRPDFADIPHADDMIPAGQPVCTMLAEAATEAACEQRLRERAAELDRLFGWDDFGVGT